MAALDLGKTGLLQGNGVIGVEVIDPDHLFAPFQQSQRRMEADEPCGSGNKHGHSSSSLLLRLDQSCQRRRSGGNRSEEHTSELQSLMRISYAVFCLKKKINHNNKQSSILQST